MRMIWIPWIELSAIKPFLNNFCSVTHILLKEATGSRVQWRYSWRCSLTCSCDELCDIFLSQLAFWGIRPEPSGPMTLILVHWLSFLGTLLLVLINANRNSPHLAFWRCSVPVDHCQSHSDPYVGLMCFQHIDLWMFWESYKKTYQC